MRIAQLTDLHVGLPGEDTYGVDVRSNFKNILNAAVAANPDYLVISGDLCYHDGQEAIYHWIKTELDATGIPYFLIAGNHDDADMMTEVFQLNHLTTEGRLYYEATLGGFPVLFLDTSTYTADAKQLSWLAERLRQSQLSDRLVFIHHPPLLAGVPFMDERYPLSNWAEVLEALNRSSGRLHVFCGHYHVDKVVSYEQLTVYLTPSTFFQIDDQGPEFAVAHLRPGFRLIDWDGRQLIQGVHYLNNEEKPQS
jgi:Icc protein